MNDHHTVRRTVDGITNYKCLHLLESKQLTLIGSQQFHLVQITRIKVWVKKVSSTLEIIHCDGAGSAESQAEEHNQLFHMAHWTTQNKNNRIEFVRFMFHWALLLSYQLSIIFFFFCVFSLVSFPITIIKTIILRHDFFTEPLLKKCMQSMHRNFGARHKIYKLQKKKIVSHSSWPPLSSYPTL